MEINYEWKTTLFSSKFEIYRNGILTGELNKGSWKNKVAGELSNRKIIFDTKGFFRYNTSIIDLNDNSTIGTISYTTWKSTASIDYRNSIYKNGAIVRYISGALKGTIYSYTGDEILILSGFFIRNFIRQRSAGVSAAT
jgi:hypothetical protein